jgi:hypothetical protein
MKLAPVTEAAFTRTVIDFAHVCGWRCVHFRPAVNRRGIWSTPVQGDGVGYPDLVCVRERVVYAELKLNRGRLRPEQEEWIDRLKAARQEVYLWRPCDWSRIEDVLLGTR